MYPEKERDTSHTQKGFIPPPCLRWGWRMSTVELMSSNQGKCKHRHLMREGGWECSWSLWCKTKDVQFLSYYCLIFSINWIIRLCKWKMRKRKKSKKSPYKNKPLQPKQENELFLVRKNEWMTGSFKGKNPIFCLQFLSTLT